MIAKLEAGSGFFGAGCGHDPAKLPHLTAM
jgi:hypothetical protein